jgi:hypothetical protein
VNESSFDPQKLIWFGLIGAASLLLVFGFLSGPPGGEEPVETPPPSPETATLQCLDGKRFESVDVLARPSLGATDTPFRARWTLSFADGRYTLDQAGVQETGTYRCSGPQIVAQGSSRSHAGLFDSAGNRLEWDSLGFEGSGSPAPATSGTSG